jgi:hypothetical protein
MIMVVVVHAMLFKIAAKMKALLATEIWISYFWMAVCGPRMMTYS